MKGVPKGGDKKPGVGQLPNMKADAGVDRANLAKEAIAANDSFNKHYNKELKVSEGKSLNRLLIRFR